MGICSYIHQRRFILAVFLLLIFGVSCMPVIPSISIPSFALKPVTLTYDVDGNELSSTYTGNGKEFIIASPSGNNSNTYLTLNKSDNFIQSSSEYLTVDITGRGSNTLLLQGAGAYNSINTLNSASVTVFSLDVDSSDDFNFGTGSTNTIVSNAQNSNISSLGKVNSFYFLNTGSNNLLNFSGTSVETLFIAGRSNSVNLASGNDFVSFSGDSTVNSGITLTGAAGNKTVYLDGNYGNVSFSGTGSNRIYASKGDYLINPGKGNSFVQCGSGVDRVFLESSAKSLTLTNFFSDDKLILSQSAFSTRFNITDTTSWSVPSGNDDILPSLKSDYFVLGSLSTADHAQFLYDSSKSTLSFSTANNSKGTVIARLDLASGSVLSVDSINMGASF